MMPWFSNPHGLAAWLTWKMPEVVSTYGDKVDGIFLLIAGVTGTAAALVLVSLVYLCIRYRQRSGQAAHYTHGNSRSALLLTLVLSILVFLSIDMNAVRASNAVAREIQGGYPKAGEALVIRVLAQQFAWNIHYSGKDLTFGKTDPKYYASDNLVGLDEDDEAGYDDIITTGRLVVPVNQPVILELRSKDVIHSLFLPNMRVKQDVVPGMKTRLWFEATKEGKYEIACAELCGLGHYKMRGNLEVLSKEAYQAWVKANTSE